MVVCHDGALENLLKWQNFVPQVQHKLAEIKTALSVCRAFVDSCLSLHNNSKLDSEMASMAKYWATDLENRVAGECLQLHGGETFQYLVSSKLCVGRFEI